MCLVMKDPQRGVKGNRVKGPKKQGGGCLGGLPEGGGEVRDSLKQEEEQARVHELVWGGDDKGRG